MAIAGESPLDDRGDGGTGTAVQWRDGTRVSGRVRGVARARAGLLLCGRDEKESVQRGHGGGGAELLLPRGGRTLDGGPPGGPGDGGRRHPLVARVAKAKIYPCVDLRTSRSRLLETKAGGDERAAIAERARQAVSPFVGPESRRRGHSHSSAPKSSRFSSRNRSSVPSPGRRGPAFSCARGMRFTAAPRSLTGCTMTYRSRHSISQGAWQRSAREKASANLSASLVASPHPLPWLSGEVTRQSRYPSARQFGCASATTTTRRMRGRGRCSRRLPGGRAFATSRSCMRPSRLSTSTQRRCGAKSLFCGVEAEAHRVLGNDASRWMTRPSRLLDGMAPADFATSREGALLYCTNCGR